MKLNDLIQRVRSHPGVPAAMSALGDDDFAFAVAQLVFPAMNQLSESVGQVIDQRNYVMSDPTTVTATLDADGTTNLTTLIAEKGILLERLRFGEIKHPSSVYPLKPLGGSGEGSLPSNYSSFGFLSYWVVGRTLSTRSSDNNQTPLTGDLSFAVPCVGGLDTLSPQLEDNLVDLVVTRLRGATAPQAGAK